ncbi:thiamine pyrophosphate-dependent enzyme [Reinekea sp.]|uniref:thiamine pyrophosphate-dependent dehydrogenase E1 component subunit alpha n=1 Tax=Reinekea sp. TaxID=1970455 RepID=UPI00258036D3|nr:thiamine pyrophosphate-dependent enzyme [Reinekea sp.]
MKDGISNLQRRHLLTQMLRLRRFEHRSTKLVQDGSMHGLLPQVWREGAMAVGVMQALTADDRVVAAARCHLYALALGVPMNDVMAELFGKITGPNRGRGGSFHLYDPDRRFYGDHSLAAGGLPMAVGLAWSDKLQQRNRVTVCFASASLSAPNEWVGSLNLARSAALPLLCIAAKPRTGQISGAPLAKAGRISEPDDPLFEDHLFEDHSFDGQAIEVDESDVIHVAAAAKAACDAIRRGEGPQFLAYDCRPLRVGQPGLDDTGKQVLNSAEPAAESWPDPGAIEHLSQWLRDHKKLSDAAGAAIETALDWEFNEAVRFAEASGREPANALFDRIFAHP